MHEARLVFTLLWVAGWLAAGASCTAMAGTEPLSTDALPSGPLGEHTELMVETDGTPYTPAQARAEFDAGRGVPGDHRILSAGLGAAPRWVRLSLLNPHTEAVPLKLAIGLSWTDYLDIYLYSASNPMQAWLLGDARKGAPGLVAGIGFAQDILVPPGTSDLLMRAETADPFALDIQLRTPANWQSFLAASSYRYGLTYGFLLALLAYNAILFIGLRERSHIYYSLYLASFIFTNMAYTGHGQAWMWPDSPDFQRYVILIAMVLTGCSGLLFAQRFLVLEQHAPRLCRGVSGYSLAGIVLILIFALADMQYAAVVFAFSFFTLFTVMMVGMGLLSWHHHVERGRYFLYAAVCGALGSASTALAGWGVIPYTSLTYHAIEWGLMMEATLFALALSSQMRHYQRERQKAETMARHDPLTGLLNRRGFNEVAKLTWSQAQRRNRPLSVLMLDIDHFKRINDTHGHDIGDAALVEVSHALSTCCRNGDVLARWGGEEFALLLPDTAHDEALASAERVRRRVAEQPLTLGASTIQLTISIGLAERQGSASLAETLAQADQRLLNAKAQGRNQVVFGANPDDRTTPLVPLASSEIP